MKISEIKYNQYDNQKTKCKQKEHRSHGFKALETERRQMAPGEKR
jgi:hypothetical protein